jgi:hypothetical protein
MDEITGNKPIRDEIDDRRYEDALSHVMHPHNPDPEFVNRLKTRLTVDPAILVEDKTPRRQTYIQTAVVLCLMAGAFGLVWRITRLINHAES